MTTVYHSNGLSTELKGLIIVSAKASIHYKK